MRAAGGGRGCRVAPHRPLPPAPAAAKKANSLRTWKEVNAACVKAGEFKLAQVCGLNIIVSPDHLEELIHYYEEAGHWEELVKLLEQGVGLENAHAGIFTELGVMYSRYRPESLMAHIKVFHARMNASKILRACEAGRHWEESTFRHIATEDFDQAIKASGGALRPPARCALTRA